MTSLIINENSPIYDATTEECSNLFVHIITDKEYQFNFKRVSGEITAENSEEYLQIMMFDLITEDEHKELSKISSDNPELESSIVRICHVNERMINFANHLTDFLNKFQKTFNLYVKQIDSGRERPSDVFITSVFDNLALAYETISNNAYTAFALAARRNYQDIEMCSIAECRAELFRAKRSHQENLVKESKLSDSKDNQIKKLEKKVGDLEAEIKRLKQEKEELKKQKKANDKSSKIQGKLIAELELKSAVFEKPQTRGRRKMRSEISSVKFNRYLSLPPIRKMNDYYSYDDKTRESLSNFIELSRQNMVSLMLS